MTATEVITTDTAVVIREAHPHDFSEIAQVGRAAIEEFREAMGPRQFRAYQEYTSDVAKRAQGGQVIVAEMEGRIVGTITYCKAGYDELLHAPFPAGTAAIRSTAVLPAARGMGIGRRLVDECLQRAKRDEVPAVALHTGWFMIDAMGLYERFGFRRSPEHDVVMSDYFGDAGNPDETVLAFLLQLS